VFISERSRSTTTQGISFILFGQKIQRHQAQYELIAAKSARADRITGKRPNSVEMMCGISGKE